MGRQRVRSLVFAIEIVRWAVGSTTFVPLSGLTIAPAFTFAVASTAASAIMFAAASTTVSAISSTVASAALCVGHCNWARDIFLRRGAAVMLAGVDWGMRGSNPTHWA